MAAGDPPTESGLSRVAGRGCIGRAKQVADGVGRGGAGGFAARLHGGDFAGGVRQGEEVAIFGLPGILTGISNGGGVAIAEQGQGGEKFGLAAQRHMLLAGHDLEGGERVLRVEAELAFGADFNELANGEEGAKGHREDDQDQGQEEFGTEAEAVHGGAQPGPKTKQ